MAVLGRLIVAHLIASCATAVVITVWGALQFSLQLPWVVDGVFILAVLTTYFYAAYQVYFSAKRKWF